MPLSIILFEFAAFYFRRVLCEKFIDDVIQYLAVITIFETRFTLIENKHSWVYIIRIMLSSSFECVLESGWCAHYDVAQVPTGIVRYIVQRSFYHLLLLRSPIFECFVVWVVLVRAHEFNDR